MPDGLEWLVEYRHDGEPMFEHIASREDAIDYVRQLVGQGRLAVLYQLVPFEVKVDITVKAPRKRRKSPSPADKPASDPPTGPGNGEAGEPKGAASPQAAESGGRAGAPHPESQQPASNLASPVFPWTCEARFDGDPACPGPAELDPVSLGRFCPLHMIATPEPYRREMHRIHGSRNRPVRVAHAG